MTVNVMVEIGGEIGGQVVGHAVEVFKRLEQRRRLLVHRLNAHDGAGRPRNILRKFDDSPLNDGGDAHDTKLGSSSTVSKPRFEEFPSTALKFEPEFLSHLTKDNEGNEGSESYARIAWS